MDVRVDAAGGEDQTFARDRFGGDADDHRRAHTDHHRRVACLADADDAARLDADIGFVDAGPIDDEGIRDHEIERIGIVGASELFSLNINPDGTSFWTGDDGTGFLYKFDILTGALLDTINTGVGGGNLFGVSVYGELTSGGGGVGNETPLPAALPLFATGLGALGLLGWRRKRKQAA